MNKPAFARPLSVEESGYYDDQQGMSLLEYYAGQALPSVATSCIGLDCKVIANMAFNIAEAMIQEAEKRSNRWL